MNDQYRPAADREDRIFGSLNRCLRVWTALIFLGWTCGWSDALHGFQNAACVVCGGQPLRGRILRHPKGYVCEDCAQLKTRCSICGLPAKTGFLKTDDGRIICRDEAPHVVLDERAAAQLFRETERGIARMSRGLLLLKNQQVSVKLYDVDYWNYEDGKPKPEQLQRVGFSSSRESGEGISHIVMLHSGHVRNELYAICAHEFMHLWINENKKKERKINPDTVEAVCELIAYKLVETRRDAAQMEKIRKNTYTNGKINTLLAYDQRHGTKSILDWIRFGDSYDLAMEGIGTFNAPKPPQPRIQYATTPRSSRTYNHLVLKGISGARNNRMALINGKIFSEGTVEKIKVANQTFTVECVKILDRSVEVRVNEGEDTVELKMNAN